MIRARYAHFWSFHENTSFRVDAITVCWPWPSLRGRALQTLISLLVQNLKNVTLNACTTTHYSPISFQTAGREKKGLNPQTCLLNRIPFHCAKLSLIFKICFHGLGFFFFNCYYFSSHLTLLFPHCFLLKYMHLFPISRNWHNAWAEALLVPYHHPSTVLECIILGPGATDRLCKITKVVLLTAKCTI